MTTESSVRPNTPNAELDQELEQLLKLAEGGIDQETQKFIDEVLKFVPEESVPEYHIVTSHEGALDACEN